MAEAIDHSLSHLPDADLQSIAVYLKSVPPVKSGAAGSGAEVRPAPNSYGKPLTTESDFRGEAVPADRNKLSGAQMYDAYCASCHQASGTGSYTGALPPLVHNTALGHDNGDNVVMAILHGVRRGEDGENVTMPAFGTMLSDVQISTLANYAFQQFGNPQVSVSTERVAALRAGGTPSSLLRMSRVGMALAAMIVIVLLRWWLRRRWLR